MEMYDVLVIGSGQAGGPLATAFAQAGKKTALIEGAEIGGTCINWGCTPTKTLIASSSAAHLAQHAQEYGVQVSGVSVDFPAVIRRKDQVVQSFRSGSERRIANGGVDIVRGWAAFSGPKTVDVQLNDGGTRQFSAETIVINSGERPRQPDLPGLGEVVCLDSTSVMALDALPEHLVILGGGYVALEFGQFFRRLGSQVTILQRGPQLLAREDPDVVEALQEVLKAEGIHFYLNANAQQVRQRPDGRIELRVSLPDGEQTVVGSHLLAAIGRVPNSEQLNLAQAGIQTDAHGHVITNDRLETNVPGVYAVGDIKGGPAFTHISYDDYRILKMNLLEGGQASIAGRMVPYVVFTDPQLGRIGMSEKEARAAGVEYQAAQMPMEYVARAIEMGRPQGLMKVLVDPRTRKILGAAILGVEGGELMSMIEIAMMSKLPYTALRDGIFAHPTLSEGLNNLFATLK